MNIDNMLKNKAVMIYFSSPDCNVCDAIKPKLFNAIENRFENFKMFDVDISKDPQTAAHFSVFSVPSVLVFFDSKEFIRQGRSFSIEELLQKIQRPYKIMLG